MPDYNVGSHNFFISNAVKHGVLIFDSVNIV